MENPSQAVPHADAVGAFPTPAGSQPSPSQASLSSPGCWLLFGARQSSSQPPSLSASSVGSCCHLAGPWGGGHAAAGSAGVFPGTLHRQGLAVPELSRARAAPARAPTGKPVHARWCLLRCIPAAGAGAGGGLHHCPLQGHLQAPQQHR